MTVFRYSLAALLFFTLLMTGKAMGYMVIERHCQLLGQFYIGDNVYACVPPSAPVENSPLTTPLTALPPPEGNT